MTGDGASILAAIFGTLKCHDFFRCNQDLDQHGGIALWFLLMLYMFKALGTICDEYFVPALEVIVERLQVSNDVAGATFMAAGSSAPELFTSVVATFLIVNAGGVGTIIGSAIFNILVMNGVTAFVACKDQELKIWWYPLARDTCFYCLAILELVLVLMDEQVMWYEGFFMVLTYLAYCVYMKFNPVIVDYFGIAPASKQDGSKFASQDVKVGIQGSAKVMPSDMQDSTIPQTLGKERAGGSEASGSTGSQGSCGKAPRPSTASNIADRMSWSLRKSQMSNTSGRVSMCSQRSDRSDRTSGFTVSPVSATSAISFQPNHSTSSRESGKSSSESRSTLQVDDNRLSTLATAGSMVSYGGLNSLGSNMSGDMSGRNSSASGTSDVPRTCDSTIPATGDVSANPADIPDDELEGEEEEEEQGRSWCRDPLCVFWEWTLPCPDRWHGFCLFFASIAWIGLCTYVMVDSTGRMGIILRIPPFVMGLIFLAAGTSIPDTLGSVAVAKQGEGDMAVANALGSNVFDILIGLGVPWTIRGLSAPLKFDANFEDLIGDIIILAVVLFVFVGCLVLNKWTLNQRIGLVLIAFYVIFVTYQLLAVFVVKSKGIDESEDS